MESHSSSHLSSSITPSEDDQNISAPRKHHKTKQKRKSSSISVRDDDKTKSSRESKSKQSLAQNEQEMSDSSKSMPKHNLRSIVNNHRSTIKLLQRQQEDKSREATLNLMQMTLDEKDVAELPQRNEVIIEEEPSTSTETEQSNIDLEEKFDEDDESDIGSTMNLSSSNVTDNDIPLIIQRVRKQEKKKYTCLVLRDNALTPISVKILVDELLKTPTNLRNLGLSSNPGIGDEGIEHLIRLLQGTQSITILALHNTGITDRSVRLLADVLCDPNTHSISPLAKLYVSFNKSITDESLDALIRILEQNQTLKLLALQYCSLSNRARRQLRQIGAKKKKRKFSLAI